MRVYAFLAHVCSRIVRHINSCARNDGLRIVTLDWLSNCALSSVTDDALHTLLLVAELGSKFSVALSSDNDSEDEEADDSGDEDLQSGAGNEEGGDQEPVRKVEACAARREEADQEEGVVVKEERMAVEEEVAVKEERMDVEQ